MQRFFFIFSIFFAVTAIFTLIFSLWWGINAKNRSNETLPVSPMIGQKATIPLRLNPLKGYPKLPQKLPNQFIVINFFASWCPPCVIEHPHLAKLYDQEIPIYGINWKDSENKAIQFLKTHGNVYQATGFDPEGHLGIAYGIKGLPETFVVDNQGIIVYHLRGPLSENDVKHIQTFFRK